MAKKKFDISNHILVPKHVKVADKERDRILKKYNITAMQLPRILIDDPAVVDLKVSHGDVVKVARSSPTSGEIDFYRCVIDG